MFAVVIRRQCLKHAKSVSYRNCCFQGLQKMQMIGKKSKSGYYFNLYDKIIRSNQQRMLATNFSEALKRLNEEDARNKVLEMNETRSYDDIFEAQHNGNKKQLTGISGLEEKIRQADELWQSQDFENAMESYGNILETLLQNNYDDRNNNTSKEVQNYMAESLTRLGMCHAALNDHHEALMFYNKATEILDALFPHQPHEKRGILLNATAMSYGNMGQMDEARTSFELALKELEGSSSVSREKVANIHENLGTLCVMSKDNHAALEHFELALSIRRSENEESTVASGDIAGLLLNIGRMHQSMKNLEKALEIYQESISIIGDDIHPVSAQAHFNLALIYSDTNRFDDALEAHQRALSLQLSLLGEMNENVAESYNHLGTIMGAKSERGEALKYFRKALQIYRAIGAEQTNPDYMNVRRNIALIESSSFAVASDQ